MSPPPDFTTLGIMLMAFGAGTAATGVFVLFGAAAAAVVIGVALTWFGWRLL
jgi:hypothetical protein